MFTAFDPMFWVNCAVSVRPGWSQFESTAGNGSSPQRFSKAAVDLFVQLSCV